MRAVEAMEAQRRARSGQAQVEVARGMGAALADVAALCGASRVVAVTTAAVEAVAAAAAAPARAVGGCRSLARTYRPPLLSPRQLTTRRRKAIEATEDAAMGEEVAEQRSLAANQLAPKPPQTEAAPLLPPADAAAMTWQVTLVTQTMPLALEPSRRPLP